MRGRGGSEGEWYAFAREAPDGYDTIEWAAAQPWSSGKVGTMGTSYMAATQSAAATLNPPHLAAMFITEGPSNYYHCSMRHNGALEQRFLIYAFHMAVTSPEARANPALRLALMEARTNLGQWLRRLPLKRGATPLRMLPSYEQWAIDLQTRAVYDEYWLQRGYAINEYYAEHADVPTVYFGAWYDSYARATTENFRRTEPSQALAPAPGDGSVDARRARRRGLCRRRQLRHRSARALQRSCAFDGSTSGSRGWTPASSTIRR